MKEEWKEVEYKGFVKNSEGFDTPVVGTFKFHVGETPEASLVSLKGMDGRKFDVSDPEKERIERDCAYEVYRCWRSSSHPVVQERMKKSNLKIAKELVILAKSLIADDGALDDAEGDRIEEKANIYLEYEQVSRVKVLFFASFDCEREALNDSGAKKLARDCEERIRNDIREINRQVKDALCDQGKPSFTSNFSGYANARVYVKGVGQIYADVNNSDDVKPICDVLRKLGYKRM